MSFLVASVAGALGAACRYLLSGYVQSRARSDFPLGTLFVNLTASFLVGVAAGTGTTGSAPVMGVVGFLGGFSTFSTWMVESVRLGRPVLGMRGAWNVLATMAGGVVLAAAGYSLTH